MKDTKKPEKSLSANQAKKVYEKPKVKVVTIDKVQVFAPSCGGSGSGY